MRTRLGLVCLPPGSGRLSFSIPKVSGAVLSPADFRPIALQQVQLKILHRWLAGCLQGWAAGAVHPCQFGFLRGRRISDCLARAELSVWQCAGFARDAAVLSLDVANAFGSVSRVWLLEVLERSGAGHEWLAIFAEWLKPGSCKILWRRRLFEGFQILSGVPQGDPLSAVVFVICLDPFCRFLCRLLPSPCCLVAFADDLLVVLASLACLACVEKAFALLGEAAALRVNLRKTKWLPLSERDLDEFVLLIPEGAFREAEVVSGLRWLGWWLSQDYNGVAQTSWEKVARRAPALRDLWGGVAQQVRLVGPLVDSVLAHCFRVSAPHSDDFKWRRAVLTAQLGRLSPWLQCLCDRGRGIAGWPAEVRSLEELALQWGFSALSVSSLDVVESLSLVDRCRGHMDRKLVSPVDGWLLQGCWVHWGRCLRTMFEQGWLRECRPNSLRVAPSSLRRRFALFCRPSLSDCLSSLGSLLRASLSRCPLPPLFRSDRIVAATLDGLPALAKHAGPSAPVALLRALLGSLPACSRRHTGCCFCGGLCTRSVPAVACLPCFKPLLGRCRGFAWLQNASPLVILHWLSHLASLSPNSLRKLALYFKVVCRTRWLCAHVADLPSCLVQGAAFTEVTRAARCFQRVVLG